MIEIRRLLPRVAALMFAAFLVSGCQTTPHKVEAPNTEINTQRTLERANAAYAAGQHESALAQYLLVLSTDQDNVEVIEKIALINEALGNPGAAEQAYRRILHLNEDHPGALSGLGMLMLNRGEKESAEELLKKSIGEKDGNWRVYNGLGVISDLDKKYVEARKFYVKALSQQPRSSEIINNIGFSHYLEGDLTTALSFFEDALRINPRFAPAISNIGLVYLRLGRPGDAEHAFRKIMEPREALNSVGYLSMISGNKEVAETYFRQAIKTSPTYYKEAQENLKRLRSEY